MQNFYKVIPSRHSKEDEDSDEPQSIFRFDKEVEEGIKKFTERECP
jgi:hypothetical protein